MVSKGFPNVTTSGRQHQHQHYDGCIIVLYLYPPVQYLILKVTQVQHLETAANIVLLIVLTNSTINSTVLRSS